MTSYKVPSTALSYFFRRSAYYLYSLAPEKTRRLAPQWHFLRGVYGPFYLAIISSIKDFLRVIKKLGGKRDVP